MKILFVAMPESIHTVRWIHQLKNEGWELYLFPDCDDRDIHKEMDEVTICIPFYKFIKKAKKSFLGKFVSLLYTGIVIYRTRNTPEYYPKRLKRYINAIKPDIIHSLETQSAGYLLAKVRSEYMKGNNFPFWLHTLWGSDISLFGQLQAHKGQIKRVMDLCDNIIVDCKRDRLLLDQLNVSSKILDVEHATSGFDITRIQQLRDTLLEKTSARKQIMLKGYQGWSGRSLVAIRALSRCRDVLFGYTLAVYSYDGSDEIKISLELFSNETGVPVIFIPEKSSHATLLENQGKSRVSIGLGISDGVPNSVLEAMAMGSFPVQSFTSAADEWIKDGETGFLVPPEDPEIVEIALRKALTNDQLVDIAAQKNWETVCSRANFKQLTKAAIHTYNYINDKISKN